MVEHLENQGKSRTGPFMRKVRVMFVCMGNICRSPSAEGVFRRHIEDSGLGDCVEIASCGTHDYHVGDKADKRSAAAALKRGIDLSDHRAQHFNKSFFEDYDYVLVMDDINYAHITGLAQPQFLEKIHYFLDYAPQLGVREVPDPYYGGPDGFEHVLDLIDAATVGLVGDIRERYIDPANKPSKINA